MYTEIIENRINEDCGCQEQHLNIGLIDTVIHIEPNGTGEAFFNAGDWEQEVSFPTCDNIDDLREQAEEYILSLPVEAW